MQNISFATIPKELTKEGELVVVPLKEYQAYFRQKHEASLPRSGSVWRKEGYPAIHGGEDVI